MCGIVRDIDVLADKVVHVSRRCTDLRHRLELVRTRLAGVCAFGDDDGPGGEDGEERVEGDLAFGGEVRDFCERAAVHCSQVVDERANCLVSAIVLRVQSSRP